MEDLGEVRAVAEMHILDGNVVVGGGGRQGSGSLGGRLRHGIQVEDLGDVLELMVGGAEGCADFGDNLQRLYELGEEANEGQHEHRVRSPHGQVDGQRDDGGEEELHHNVLQDHGDNGSPQGATASLALALNGLGEGLVVGAGEAGSPQGHLGTAKFQQAGVGVDLGGVHIHVRSVVEPHSQLGGPVDEGCTDQQTEPQPPVEDEADDDEGEGADDIADVGDEDVHGGGGHKHGSLDSQVGGTASGVGVEPAEGEVDKFLAEAPVHGLDDDHAAVEGAAVGHHTDNDGDQGGGGENTQPDVGLVHISLQHAHEDGHHGAKGGALADAVEDGEGEEDMEGASEVFVC